MKAEYAKSIQLFGPLKSTCAHAKKRYEKAVINYGIVEDQLDALLKPAAVHPKPANTITVQKRNNQESMPLSQLPMSQPADSNEDDSITVDMLAEKEKERRKQDTFYNLSSSEEDN